MLEEAYQKFLKINGLRDSLVYRHIFEEGFKAGIKSVGDKL